MFEQLRFKSVRAGLQNYHWLSLFVENVGSQNMMTLAMLMHSSDIRLGPIVSDEIVSNPFALRMAKTKFWPFWEQQGYCTEDIHHVLQ